MNTKRQVILLGTSVLGLSLVLLWVLSSTGKGIHISHAAGYDSSQKPDYQGYQPIPIDGLVAYYPFNGNANDESGHGHDGTVFGATLTTDRFGNPNHAYSLDGVDDYIDLGDQYITDDSAAFSISLWANISGGSDDGPTMIRLKGYTSEFQYAHRVALYFGFRSFIGITCSNPQCILNNFIDEWHHHLIVYDGGDKNSLGSYKLYRDGVEMSLESSGYVGGWDDENELGRDWLELNHLDGILDDARIYDRELTESEILALYYELVTDPVVLGIEPNTTVVDTGDLPVTISGLNLSIPISAQIDSVSLLTPTLVSSTTLNAVVPVNSLDVGVYDLVVTSDGVTTTLHDAFTVGAAGPWYVAPDGDDGDDCLSPATPCVTIDGALNKPSFLADSTILVATGIYTGTGSEVVLLDKSVTLSGGWDERSSDTPEQRPEHVKKLGGGKCCTEQSWRRDWYK